MSFWDDVMAWGEDEASTVARNVGSMVAVGEKTVVGSVRYLAELAGGFASAGLLGVSIADAIVQPGGHGVTRPISGDLARARAAGGVTTVQGRLPSGAPGSGNAPPPTYDMPDEWRPEFSPPPVDTYDFAISHPYLNFIENVALPFAKTAAPYALEVYKAISQKPQQPARPSVNVGDNASMADVGAAYDIGSAAGYYPSTSDFASGSPYSASESSTQRCNCAKKKKPCKSGPYKKKVITKSSRSGRSTTQTFYHKDAYRDCSKRKRA